MDCRKIGNLIKQLRTEKKLTQQQLADKLEVTDRAVSKWERGDGCPDITLIKKLATILEIHPDSLLQGELPKNLPDPGKLVRTSFFVCPKCGDIITATGKASVSCCGMTLKKLDIKSQDNDHRINIQTIDDEFYITFNHCMEKEHFIKFICYLNLNTMHIVRLYPEQSSEIRTPVLRGGHFLIYCNKEGLFLQ